MLFRREEEEEEEEEEEAPLEWSTAEVLRKS
jgi:hypothetical protein